MTKRNHSWTSKFIALCLNPLILFLSSAREPALQMWLSQCWVKRRDHLPQPTGNTLSNSAQHAAGHLWVHCWFVVSLVPPRIPGSFSAKLLSSWWSPRHYGCLGLFLPKCRTLHFPLFNFMRFSSALFSNVSQTPWMTASPSRVPTTRVTQFCILCELAECALCSSVQAVSEEYWHLLLPIGHSARDLPLTGLHTADHHLLGPSHLVSFKAVSLFIYLTCTLLVCLLEYYGIQMLRSTLD